MTLMLNDIKAIIGKQIRKPVEEIADNKLMHDELGVDSLDTVEILLCLEEDYGILIEEDKFHKGMTVIEFATVILNNTK